MGGCYDDPSEEKEGQEEELKSRMAELAKIKEELKRAKDRAMQSWLDSRPLIDELEKLQSAVDMAKNRFNMSSIILSDHQAELENIHKNIRSKKEDELKARKMTRETEQEMDKTREEMERVKVETDEERRARSKLKQVLRLRKQTLRKFQLSLRAVRMESEAFAASEAEAIAHFNRLEMNSGTVDLSHDDYIALTKRGQEETSLADWRVSVAAEQRLMVEASLDAAVKRLAELNSEQNTKIQEIEDENGYEARLDAEDYVSRGRTKPRTKYRKTPYRRHRRGQLPDQLNGSQQTQSEKIERVRIVKKNHFSINYKLFLRENFQNCLVRRNADLAKCNLLSAYNNKVL